MDYGKYKNALEKAKVRYNEIKDTDCSEKKFLLDLFPELRESEDERIRKELYDFVYITTFRPKELKKKERFLNWLEKQGKQKPTWSEEDEKIITALKEGFRYHQLFNPTFGEVPNAEIIDWLKSLKERLL